MDRATRKQLEDKRAMGQASRIQVIRIEGKAKDVFGAMGKLAKTRGAESLGSIIKEDAANVSNIQRQA